MFISTPPTPSITSSPTPDTVSSTPAQTMIHEALQSANEMQQGRLKRVVLASPSRRFFPATFVPALEYRLRGLRRGRGCCCIFRGAGSWL